MSGRRLARALLFVLSLLPARLALAHPMGNFSVNHYTRIWLERNTLRLRYIIDLAEIPAFQEMQQAGLSASALSPQDPAVLRFAATRGAELGRGLLLTLDGHPLAVRLRSSTALFPPGAGGLPTLKLGYLFEATLPPATTPVRLHFADTNYPGHSGWKEIVTPPASGGDTLTHSTAPASDRSAELTDYPTDLLSSPPQTLEATVEATVEATLGAAVPTPPSSLAKGIAPAPRAAAGPPLSSVAKGGGPVSPAPATAPPLRANRRLTPRDRFTQLVAAQRLSPWFLFTAALIAIGLGGLHALEPGHGKTIVAAYLVGSRGTARHAVLLGLIVTASHTFGVFALGAVTLYASRSIVPEQLYPWLGVLSGLVIAVLGAFLLLRRLTGTATDHDHTRPGSHAHWLPWPRPTLAPGGASPRAEGPLGSLSAPAPLPKTVGLGQLLTLGITGGIIPCPAALIVLLSAFALHRIGLGFFLIVAFSVGLAGVLIGFGLALVFARRLVSRVQWDGPLTQRWLPVLSAACMVMLGVVLAVQGFAAANLHLGLRDLTPQRLGPLVYVIGLGLLLGMRHSTDADHVVAISTIVGKQRSIRGAALIGTAWGVGHTITIFGVGALIILFGVEIPPRLGLSMEFTVAVMLVLLGLLNLTGVLGRITTRFTAGPPAPASRRVPLGSFHVLRPLVIGLVHGLAGSAAVALLVLSTIHNPLWATFYLLVFGGGTLLGMMGMTAAMAVPFTYMGDRCLTLGRLLNYASGLASLCFGSFLMYQLGYLNHLFGSHPVWTPQ